MEIIPAETSLVVAGAWNSAILTPEWVLKHGLEREGEEQVQIFFPAGFRIAAEPPRFMLKEFAYSVRPDALVISPLDAATDSFPIFEEAVAKMADVLRHTPISGIGHNFEFRDRAPSPNHLDVFTNARQDIADRMPDGWEAADSRLACSFRKIDPEVVINIARAYEADGLIVKFNFHHPIASTEQASSVLRGQNNYLTMTGNLELAKEIISDIYGGDRATQG